eukprot:7344462-Pyramimonas_sp.AAC.1
MLALERKQKRARPGPVAPHAPPPPGPINVPVFCAEHIFSDSGNACLRCCGSASQSELLEWRQSPCHELQNLGGMFPVSS